MLVDDEPDVLATLMKMTGRAGWFPLPCSGLADVRRFFDASVIPSVIVTDLVLDRDTGVSVERFVRSRGWQGMVAYSTGYSNVSPPTARSIVLPKPVEPDIFAATIRELTTDRSMDEFSSGE